MTAPRVPMLTGWWDEIEKPVQQIGQGLTNIFDPDKELRDMLRKKALEDPTFVTQFANMSDTERSAFLGSLGAKKPDRTLQQFTGVQKGLKRKGEERDDEFAGEKFDLFKSYISTPEGKDEAGAAIAGGKSAIEREQTKASTDLTKAQTGVQVVNKKLLDNESVKSDQELERSRSALAAYPSLRDINVGALVESIEKGLPVDPLAMSRLMQDEGGKRLFDAYQEQSYRNADIKLRRELATLRDPSVDKINQYNVINQNLTRMTQDLSLREREIDNFVQSNSMLRQVLMKVNAEGKLDPKWAAENPAGVALYRQYMGMRKDFEAKQGRYNEIEELFMTTTKELLGIKDESGTAATSSQAGSSDKITRAVQMIKSGQATIADIDNEPRFTPEEKAQIKSLSGGEQNVPQNVPQNAPQGAPPITNLMQHLSGPQQQSQPTRQQTLDMLLKRLLTQPLVPPSGR